MNRRDFVLASLADDSQPSFTPVQLQKLLFLLDRNIGSRVGGSGFEFRPYHYGPFDQNVYVVLENLRGEGLAEISESSPRHYRLTDSGQRAGREIAKSFDPRATDYMAKVREFVRSQSFASLVSSIYRAYPDMKVNSVFQE